MTGINLKIFRLIFLVALLLIGVSATPNTLTMADSAYNKGDFEKAIELYNSAIDSEGFSAGVLFNLGNSYYQIGKEGDAMLCYERAKRIDPGNEKINHNLEFLRTKVKDANVGSLGGKNVNMESDPETFLDGIYRLIAIENSSNSWAVFATMSFILFIGALALYTFTPIVLARKTGFFSGIIFLSFSIVFIIFAFIGAHQYNRQDEAILIDFTAELRKMPSEGSVANTTPLHKGTKLMILESQEGNDGKDWVKVKLNSDNEGWIKKDALKMINPGGNEKID